MKLLDVIIPFYNQKEEYIDRAILSVTNHLDKDIYNIIMVNDGGNNVSTNLMKEFNDNIIYYECETNGGAGIARQKGIELSTSKYVTFLDSDDEFIGENFDKIINCLTAQSPDVVFADTIQEVFRNGNIVNLHKTMNDFYSLHGLFINRDYLVNSGYSFHKELRLFEDFYFCNVLYLTSRCHHLKIDIYKWKYNENSLTLADNHEKFIVKNISDHYISIKDGYKELKKRSSKMLLDFLLLGIYSLYIELESNYFSQIKYVETKNKFDKKLFELITRNQNGLLKIPESTKKSILNSAVSYYLSSYPNLVILSSFDDYMTKLRKKYK